MREKSTVINNKHGFLKSSKEFESMEFMINPLGVVFNASSKDELIAQIKEYFPEEDTLLYDNNSYTQQTIALETDRSNIEHYIDGYKSISIIDKKIPSSIVVSGCEYEITKLTSALSRNCIKVARLG